MPPLGPVEDVASSAARVEVLDNENRRRHRTAPPVPVPDSGSADNAVFAAASSALSTSTSCPSKQFACHAVSLARPQRHALRVARLGRRLAQRGGEVVDLGVRGGRVRAVLAQEAVDESACRAPGEGACQLRTYEKGVGQCLLVHGVRAGLGGGEERRAELGRVRGREHRGDLAAPHDAAGRDDRDLHGLADLRDQREQSDAGAVRLRVVPVGALVAARLDALHDDRGGSGPLHGERFLGRGRGDQGEGA